MSGIHGSVDWQGLQKTLRAGPAGGLAGGQAGVRALWPRASSWDTQPSARSRGTGMQACHVLPIVGRQWGCPLLFPSPSAGWLLAATLEPRRVWEMSLKILSILLDQGDSLGLSLSSEESPHHTRNPSHSHAHCKTGSRSSSRPGPWSRLGAGSRRAIVWARELQKWTSETQQDSGISAPSPRGLSPTAALCPQCLQL